MQDFTNKKILLSISGGIAAYKSAFLVRELRRQGAEVQVLMTKHAQQFISALSMQALSGNAVRVDLMDETEESAMSHIELAKWADYLLVAPASANIIAKFAHGLADDLLSTLYLVNRAPVIICPSMNQSMWQHPTVQENCRRLREQGVMFVGPEEGWQACGDFGPGRLSEVEVIINALRLHKIHQTLVGRKIIITAGPTREAIDPVRFLSNRSSGKMGYALALAAQAAGAEVVLISGPTSQLPPPGVVVKSVVSAKDMFNAVMQTLEKGVIFISAAAVADYTIEKPASQKIKKEKQGALQLSLQKTEDILQAVVDSDLAAFVVGFAAETENLRANAQKKLQTKQLDLLIANQVSETQGFDEDYNAVTLLMKDKQIELPRSHKVRLAGEIIAILGGILQNA